MVLWGHQYSPQAGGELAGAPPGGGGIGRAGSAADRPAQATRSRGGWSSKQAAFAAGIGVLVAGQTVRAGRGPSCGQRAKASLVHGAGWGGGSWEGPGDAVAASQTRGDLNADRAGGQCGSPRRRRQPGLQADRGRGRCPGPGRAAPRGGAVLLCTEPRSGVQEESGVRREAGSQREGDGGRHGRCLRRVGFLHGLRDAPCFA